MLKSPLSETNPDQEQQWTVFIPRLNDVFIVQDEFRIFHEVDPRFWKYFSGPLPTTEPIEVACTDFGQPVDIGVIARMHEEEHTKHACLNLRQLKWLMSQGYQKPRGNNLSCCIDCEGVIRLILTSLTEKGWHVLLPDPPLIGRFFYKV